MSNNSIQGEIDLHRGTYPERQWLFENGLIPSPEAVYEYDLIQDWYRPGAENYILDFRIISGEQSLRLIAKSCIKFSASETLQEWISRRRIVSDMGGIEVPKLYSVHSADLIEEYIPFSLGEAYKRADDTRKRNLRLGFIAIFGKLTDLGFSPLSLHDARSRGDDIVLVDFGFDLGGLTNREKNPRHPHSYRGKAEADFNQIIL